MMHPDDLREVGAETTLLGFVAKDGHGEWCWFAHRRADGIPLGALGRHRDELDAGAQWKLPVEALPLD